MQEDISRYYLKISEGKADIAKIELVQNKYRSRTRYYRLTYPAGTLYMIAGNFNESRELASLTLGIDARFEIEPISRGEFYKFVDRKEYITSGIGIIVPRSKGSLNLGYISERRDPEIVRIKVVKMPELFDPELKTWIESNQPFDATYNTERLFVTTCPRHIPGSTGKLIFREHEVEIIKEVKNEKST